MNLKASVSLRGRRAAARSGASTTRGGNGPTINVQFPSVPRCWKIVKPILRVWVKLYLWANIFAYFDSSCQNPILNYYVSLQSSMYCIHLYTWKVDDSTPISLGSSYPLTNRHRTWGLVHPHPPPGASRDEWLYGWSRWPRWGRGAAQPLNPRKVQQYPLNRPLKLRI